MSAKATNANNNQSDKPNLQLATISNTPVKVTTVPSIIPPQSVVGQNNNDEPSKNMYTESNIPSQPSQSSVDFIGPSKAVRHLFSLPYSTDKNVSVALHTIGNGTILLDSGEETHIPLFENEDVASVNNRPGRRRRPRSWSVEQEQLGGSREKDEDGMKQNTLSQERSLLASLSLLLEEERQLEKVKCVDNTNFGDGVTKNKENVHLIEDVKCKVASRALVRSECNGVGAVSDAIVSSTDTIGVKQSIGLNEAIETNTAAFSQTLHPTSTLNYPNDPLVDKLHPPKYYLSHVVPPTTEPKQYVHWNFKGMNMLVASDANIYTHADNTGDDGNIDTRNNSNSIILKVADAADLRSQMECHQAMIKAGTVIPNLDGNGRKALPPSSYAEALLKEKTEKEKKDRSDTTCLDNVKLQTCIIPSFNVGNEFAEYGFSLSPSPSSGDLNSTTNNTRPVEVADAAADPHVGSSRVPYSSIPCCTVMDTYLDNIMANVPQLALILREHGFVSNIKLMQTEDIPSLLMHPSTLGSASYPDSSHEPIFSPEIVEMNAAMLLRFLKTNCTKENSTYLLHRSAGEPNLQLFDISSISQLRQRKWIWWLALCSYRFACRLEQLQANVLSPNDKATRREYRKRQRSLLHNTLDLLQELADMDGGKHETIGAAVYEHLADTYLWSDEADGEAGTRDPRKPAPLASSSQPYGKVSVDCLNKAQNHLTKAISVLNPLLAKAKGDNSTIDLEAISLQIYGMHHKLINVCLRLADNHLQSYFSSNLVQSLRTAARMLSDASFLLRPLDLLGFDKSDEAKSYTESILIQYSWLWEYCGHFARSFAADELWRERGHTCGNDLLSLFREVDSACFSIMRNCSPSTAPKSIIGTASHGQVSLKSLTGVVVLPDDFEQIEKSVLQKEGCYQAISTAKSVIYQKPQIKRDECLVLVAATLCYCNAIDAQRLAKPSFEGEAAPPLLFQRLGDACNEIGQILLKASRQVLVTGFPNDVSEKSTAIEKSHVSAIMLTSAQFWFLEGLEQFNTGKDLRNIALLRCNLCQVSKIRANSNVVLPGCAGDIPKHESEHYLQQAVDHLVSAHESLGQRDTDQRTWDMVSEELAATLLVLGVRRRQSSFGPSSSTDPLTLKASRPSPGVEKSIVEPMERACKIYESLGTTRSAHQAAAAHYQLAIYYSKVWTCQRDETKTRERLASAFNHFGVAHNYYSYHTVGNEPTFVCLSLDFSNLYSAVSDREDCLAKALAICLDCRKAFSSDSIASTRTQQSAKEWFSQMETLASNIQERISKLLLSLVKIEKARAGEDKYRNMYRQVLSHKIATSKQDSSDDVSPESFPIHNLLEALVPLL
ncbi:hypothetical protein ACHAWO_013288 [Cyclotella atomus]|uniref:Erythroid differentiation-related factor 1 n=1 Tax=Cyclotella atomus TaxID=382360 RepID=A0ABD3PGN4_9STRA